MTEQLSRRRLLGIAGAGAALGATGLAAAALRTPDLATASDRAVAAVPFDGPHQAGITTPAQDRLHFTAFDVVTTDPGELRAMLRRWTDAARLLAAGRPIGDGGALDGAPDAPPADTGEAIGLAPAALTITLGFGPTLFDRRLGLASLRPPALADLPHFAGDVLDPALSNGDLCLQVGANDAQVALHATRQLTRLGAGVVTPRWAQLGFTRDAAVGTPGETTRNLHGFKDGTRNLDASDATVASAHLWAQPADGPEWMVDGSYLVSRRIRMTIETWDRTSLREQEAIVGRHKGTGAPLGAAHEHDEPDFTAPGADGAPAIPLSSHVRLAHPDQNGGAQLLRRGYNYVDGVDRLGRMDAGLFFLAFQRDPRRQFVPIQTRLSRTDRLNEYLRHESSAVWACPPGVTAGEAWGHTLLG